MINGDFRTPSQNYWIRGVKSGPWESVFKRKTKTKQKPLGN